MHTMNNINFEKIMLMRLDNETEIEEHTHPFLEFVYILGGNAVHHINGKSGVLKSGDYFVIDYDTPHDYYSEDESLTIVNCLFHPDFLDPSLTGAVSFNSLVEKFYFKLSGRRINGPSSNQVFADESGEIGNIVLKMVEEYNKKQSNYLDMLRCYFSQIIILIIRNIGSQNTIDPIIEEVKGYIDQNFAEHLTLDKICKHFHYSVPYLSFKFKNQIGQTFSDYLQSKRIEESCCLLVETDLSITEISQAVGYNSIKFFNRTFKKITKQTPRQFRNNEKRN